MLVCVASSTGYLLSHGGFCPHVQLEGSMFEPGGLAGKHQARTKREVVRWGMHMAHSSAHSYFLCGHTSEGWREVAYKQRARHVGYYEGLQPYESAGQVWIPLNTIGVPTLDLARAYVLSAEEDACVC